MVILYNGTTNLVTRFIVIISDVFYGL